MLKNAREIVKKSIIWIYAIKYCGKMLQIFCRSHSTLRNSVSYRNVINCLNSTKNNRTTTLTLSRLSALNSVPNIANFPVRSFCSDNVTPPEVINRKPNDMVRLVKDTIDPYWKLMRIDRPIGSWLLFWPCGWSIAMSATPGCLPDMYMLALFGAGAFIMRGAGCTINDMWDKDIDGKVERTKDRPLVSGQLTSFDALVFLAAQLGIGCTILLQLNWNSIVLGASSLGNKNKQKVSKIIIIILNQSIWTLKLTLLFICRISSSLSPNEESHTLASVRPRHDVQLGCTFRMVCRSRISGLGCMSASVCCRCLLDHRLRYNLRPSG